MIISVIERDIEDLTSLDSTLDVNLSGKVVSSRIDLTNGNVKALIFGDWSLNAQSVTRVDFSADFTIRNTTTNNLLGENMDIVQRERDTNQTSAIIILKVGHLRLTSFQKINDDLSFRGTTNVMAAISSSSSPSTTENNNNNTLASEVGNLPQSWTNVKTTITIIQNRIMILSFDESEQQVNKIFGDLPIIGVVVV
jgi:hypothetical protein